MKSLGGKNLGLALIQHEPLGFHRILRKHIELLAGYEKDSFQQLCLDS